MIAELGGHKLKNRCNLLGKEGPATTCSPFRKVQQLLTFGANRPKEFTVSRSWCRLPDLPYLDVAFSSRSLSPAFICRKDPRSGGWLFWRAENQRTVLSRGTSVVGADVELAITKQRLLLSVSDGCLEPLPLALPHRRKNLASTIQPY